MKTKIPASAKTKARTSAETKTRALVETKVRAAVTKLPTSAKTQTSASTRRIKRLAKKAVLLQDASGMSRRASDKSAPSPRRHVDAERAVPSLSLSVQYAVAAPALPRWRLRRWLERALTAARDDGQVLFEGAEINLRIVGLAEGRRLNHAFRGRDYATNVLTFEYGVGPDSVARGDIVLCLPVLRREAREQGKAPLAHAAHLTIHGALHALGYDHIKARDARRMEGLETRVLADMGIADPYAPH